MRIQHNIMAMNAYRNFGLPRRKKSLNASTPFWKIHI